MLVAAVTLSALLGYYREEVARSHPGHLTTSKTVFEVMRGRNRTYQTVFVKWPDKILYSTEDPARAYTTYDAFDGKTAWHGSSDGETVVDASRLPLIISEVAIGTNAPVVEGGWPADAQSAPDEQLFGHTYNVLHVTPHGGAPFELLFDSISHRLVLTRTNRLAMVCADIAADPNASCTNQTVVDRQSGASYTARVLSTEYGVPVADWQFAPRLPQSDSSTHAVLDTYRAAVGMTANESAFRMRGHGTYSDGSTFTWSSAGSGTDFERTLTSDSDHKSESIAVHVDSAVQRNYNGKERRDGPYGFAALLAMRHCEFHAAACGVSVTRVGNAWIAGELLYMLQVTSLKNPSVEYLVGIDSKTNLPHFLKILDDRIHLADLRHSASGSVYAAKQSVDMPRGQLTLYVDSAEFQY